jgi:hypothetical protein
MHCHNQKLGSPMSCAYVHPLCVKQEAKNKKQKKNMRNVFFNLKMSS